MYVYMYNTYVSTLMIIFNADNEIERNKQNKLKCS